MLINSSFKCFFSVLPAAQDSPKHAVTFQMSDQNVCNLRKPVTILQAHNPNMTQQWCASSKLPWQNKSTRWCCRTNDARELWAPLTQKTKHVALTNRSYYTFLMWLCCSVLHWMAESRVRTDYGASKLSLFAMASNKNRPVTQLGSFSQQRSPNSSVI